MDEKHQQDRWGMEEFMNQVVTCCIGHLRDHPRDREWLFALQLPRVIAEIKQHCDEKKINDDTGTTDDELWVKRWIG